MNNRGYVMKEFIKDLQELLGTKSDGILGKDDKIAYENKIDLKKNNNYPILPVISWGMWYKGYYGGDVKNEIF